MEIQCQLAALSVWLLPEGVFAENEKSAREGVESGGIVGAGVERASADSARAGGSEQQWKEVAIWEVVSGRRNADGRQCWKKNFATPTSIPQ